MSGIANYRFDVPIPTRPRADDAGYLENRNRDSARP
jgi:hypothetical protein